jgi:peptidoglycan hydrolase-like protein with peptidoglycan-binding domain
MNKYVTTGVVALGLFFSISLATPVQAAGLTETQITAVVNLVASFGADAATVKNVEASLRGQSTAATDSTLNPGHEGTNCVTLTHTLSLGSTDAATNGEVSKLQHLLRTAGVLSAQVNGYFGPATSGAVQTWQIAHDISITTRGVAVVGPKTRAAMACKAAY